MKSFILTAGAVLMAFVAPMAGSLTANAKDGWQNAMSQGRIYTIGYKDRFQDDRYQSPRQCSRVTGYGRYSSYDLPYHEVEYRARRFAIENWRDKAHHTYGSGYDRWPHARDKQVDCKGYGSTVKCSVGAVPVYASYNNNTW